MKLLLLVCLLAFHLSVFLSETPPSSVSHCHFPAIYTFGDSNSDTGASSAAFTAARLPNGMNFMGSFSGRFSDGRLIIDYIAEELKLPYLNAYLNALASNFSHGANFAVGGAHIIYYPGFFSPFDMTFQVDQYKQFKHRANILYKLSGSIKSLLPRPQDFSKALYVVDIGQNDLSHGFRFGSEAQVQAFIPIMIANYSQFVQELYNEGARIFWIHNTGPLGCLPHSFLNYNKSKVGNLDANGCIQPENDMALEFNRQLKGLVVELRKKLHLAKLIYVDVYAVKYKLISKSKNEGFVNPLLLCCGTYNGSITDCKEKNLCKNPSQYISWDGIHYTQAANAWVAKRILSGHFSDPPLSIGNSCF